MRPASGAPPLIRAGELIGKIGLHSLGPSIVNGSTWAPPFGSQHVSLSQAGLLRITLRAYRTCDLSARMFSIHSLLPSTAMSDRLGRLTSTRATSPMTSFSLV